MMNAQPGKDLVGEPGRPNLSTPVPPSTGEVPSTRRDAQRRNRQPLSPFALGFSVTLGAIVALGLVMSLVAMSSVVFTVFAALFIALALNPLVNLLTRAGQSRGRAIFVVALGFALLAGTTLVLVLPPLIRQALALARALPGSIDRLADQPVVQSLNTLTNGGADAAIDWLNELVGQPSFWAVVAGGALAIGGGIAGGVSSAFFTAVLTLYFLASLKSMKRGFYSLVSRSKRHTTIYLTEQITDSIGRYLGGMVVLAAINAGFSLIILTLTRVPYAGLISFAAFFITLIPLIGTVVTTVFMSIFAFLSSPVSGLIVLVAMLVYMQVEAYILTPKAMGKALHIPGATVLISATAGAVLMGFIGALIATPVAAAITLIVRRVVVPRQNAH
ncbi:AI-2E family transporter [Arthrobacter sp. 260]|uniref:AI-2E family transporter n=1 Tax=Arthrobacter sp. 260 TaxID=2735314 RepID=UPI001492CB3C|nr:AI-2E family transporter [Arthrobacter sp. 260]NOJ59673.1 AI-2E family transporter [Arthrobacter sp. 260]